MKLIERAKPVEPKEIDSFFINLIKRSYTPEIIDFLRSNYIKDTSDNDIIEMESMFSSKSSKNFIKISFTLSSLYYILLNLLSIKKIQDLKFEIEDLEDIFNKKLKPLGWIVSSTPYKSTVYINFELEPLIGDIEENLPRFLYHITLKDNVSSILKKGLIPRKGTHRNFKYEAKNFLFTKIDEKYIYELIDAFMKTDISIEDFYYGNIDYQVYSLLQIDTNKINKNFKFYTDYSVKNGVWTYSEIPSIAISYVKDF